jgi:uncharacterized membrane protein
MSGSAIFTIHFAATWFLVGLIWLVQVVVYPQFLRVPQDCFGVYHQAHMRAITFVVGPAMLVQVLTGVALLIDRPAGLPGWAAIVGLACIAVCWISTALVQVPLHNLLTSGFTTDAANRLILTNWLRTAAWTFHGGLLAWFFAK